MLVAEVLAHSALGIELLDTGRALESHVTRHDDDAVGNLQVSSLSIQFTPCEHVNIAVVFSRRNFKEMHFHIREKRKYVACCKQ